MARLVHYYLYMRHRRLVLIAWLIIGVGYFIIMAAWVRVKDHDKAFTEYVRYVVNLAAVEHRPAREIRSLLLVRAESLDIPIEGQQIQISGEGRTLRAMVAYETDLHVPFFNRSLYRFKFAHDVAAPNY